MDSLSFRRVHGEALRFRPACCLASPRRSWAKATNADDASAGWFMEADELDMEFALHETVDFIFEGALLAA